MAFSAACPAFAAKKEEQTDVGTTVYYKNDFEDGKLKSFTLTSKTNRVEVEEDKNRKEQTQKCTYIIVYEKSIISTYGSSLAYLMW